MNVVSLHGSHNAALAFYSNDGDFHVIEIERLIGYKNSGLAQYKSIPHADHVAEFAARMAKKHWGITDFDLCLTTSPDSLYVNPKGEHVRFFSDRLIEAGKHQYGPTHHFCHACGTFYQSDFDKAVIVSFDGGGDDGYFNVFVTDRRQDVPVNVGNVPYDFGFAYMVFGDYIEEIRKEPSLSDGNLIYSGKLMGLCGYGEVRTEWLEPFRQFYLSSPEGPTYRGLLATLGGQIGIEFLPHKRLSGKVSYDVAATSQRVFEEMFFKFAGPVIEKYPDHPICITGGCGLNVLLNTEVKKRYNRPMYVAPNSSDCGVALGNLLSYLRPTSPVNVMYAGLPLLDFDSLGHYYYAVSNKTTMCQYNHIEMAKLMFDGKIVGVARGGAEHGPRALGNRSIFCDPAKPQMKDVLNAKVKHREWYRPFAPVVRVEEANEYFEVLEESRYMSFAFKVRPGWQERLSSITHVDGTARVQTLRRGDNPWLYDLLGEFKKLSGHGVLLNTSFNVNGQPILSTVNEAFKVFTSSEMDGLVIEDYLFLKK